MTSPALATLEGVYKPTVRPKESIAICIYGRTGAGKTTLLGTMPGRGLVVDVPQVEGGKHVLASVADRVDIFPCHEWDDINKVFWFLKKQNHDYQWVALDSLTAMTELAKRKVVGDRKDPDLTNSPHKVRIQDWGDINQILMEMIYQFRQLAQHQIWVAQEATYGDKDDDRQTPIRVGPNTRERVMVEALLPSMFMTGRLSVDQRLDGVSERRLRVGSHTLYEAKVRANVPMPNAIVNPHLGNILRYLFGAPGAQPPEAVNEMTSILTPL